MRKETGTDKVSVRIPKTANRYIEFIAGLNETTRSALINKILTAYVSGIREKTDYEFDEMVFPERA